MGKWKNFLVPPLQFADNFILTEYRICQSSKGPFASSDRLRQVLHTGEDATLTLKPADANEGFVFRRVDLYGKPEIRPFASNVTELVRSTTISNGNAKVHTIEHVLSAFGRLWHRQCRH